MQQKCSVEITQSHYTNLLGYEEELILPYNENKNKVANEMVNNNNMYIKIRIIRSETKEKNLKECSTDYIFDKDCHKIIRNISDNFLSVISKST